MASIPSLSSVLPTTSARTEAGVTHIDLNFASAMSKGSGSIFVTDGAVQTVIDRATGQPTLRVVGATFTKVITLDQVSISGTHVMFDATGLPPGASLNVYMGAGTLQSGGQVASAITVPGSASFTTPASLPGLNATIEMDGSSLRSGQQITVTISFDKAVAELPANAIAAGNATISYLSSFDEGKTWIATLTGQAATDAPSNVLRLNMDAVAATDGSRGAGVKESPSYLVDTIVEAHVGPQILVVADEGPYYDDGVTNDDSMALAGLLYGYPKEGEHFELVINGRTIDPAQIRIEANPYASGQYWWYYSNDGEHFALGASTVQARIVGAGGHASLSATKDVVVEQDAPDIVSRPTGLVDATGSISIGFDEAMYWDDDVEVTQDIRVVDDLGNTSWIALSEDNFSADRRTLSFSAAQHNLATGNTYRIYLPEDLTDLAGNQYAGPAVGFTTAGPYQDKAPPRLVQAYIADGSGIYGKDDVLEFRLRFSERINLDAGSESDLVLYLHNGNVARYTGMSEDRKEMIFTYTVEAGDDVEFLYDVDYSSALLGHVRDDVGNIFRSAHVEYEGLTTEDGYGAVVSIDTVVAKPGAPRLHASSDTGALGDNSTTDTTPRLTGSGAEAFAKVSIYGGDVKIGSAVADASGNWDTVVTVEIGAGTHQIRVVQEDRAGNLSEVSAALDLTITAAAPPTGLTAPVLAAPGDTGISDSDGLTQLRTPAITGKGPAGTSLTLVLDGADLATVTTDASGNWSYVPTASLADGAHSFSVRQGSGAASPALSITVDGTRPALAASPDGATALNPAADIVISFSEAVHITASEGEDDMLVLRDAQDNVRRITLTDSHLSADKRSLTISASDLGLLGLKDYRIQLPSTLADLAGNAMAEYEIVFRTGADGLPTVTRVIVDSDHHVRAGETISFRVRFNESVERVDTSEMSLGLNNGARAVFSGISGNEASFTYTVAANDDQQGLAITDTSTLVGHIADLSGNLLDAAHIVLGGLYDGSGYGTWVDIDTIAPARPNAPQLDGDSNTGSLEDVLTGERRPSVIGSGAERWAKVELYEGDTLLGYSYADEDGNWEVRVESGKELIDGVHNLSARQVDDAGNRGLASLPLAVTIDGTVAALAAPRLKDGHDTGTSAIDGITSEDQPVLVGSGAEAGAKIKIFSGTTVVGFGSADASGNWNATLIDGLELDDGAYRFTVKQEDNAGNLSAASPELVFTVDRTAAAPGRPVLAAASDSGSSNSDGITSVLAPRFSGSGAEAGATIVLYAGTREIGRKDADASGNWDLTVLEADKFSADGSYAITARQIDKAGNTSAASDAFTLVIDTSGPLVSMNKVSLSQREFLLAFNEEIVFRPGGQFNLQESSSTLLSFLGNSSSGSWYLSDGTGGEDSVLNFKISMSGMYNLSMANDAIQDVAGNGVQIVGSAQWVVDLLGTSA